MGESASVEVTLVPAMARRESVEVKATADAVEQGGTAPVMLDGRVVKGTAEPSRDGHRCAAARARRGARARRRADHFRQRRTPQRA